MYKKIIVAVDIAEFEKGERILRKAASLLDEGGSIILLNVVEELPGYLMVDLPADLVVNARKDVETRLTEFLTKTALPAQMEIRQGAPAREIIAAAEERDADLIIIASHTPDLSNYFIGATADRVVRHAKCSVLVDR